jgi:hypothetical protein
MLWFMAGCATSLMAHAPITRSTVLAAPPAEAFQRASLVFTHMGGQVQMYDAPQRRLSGLVHGAVLMTIAVDAQSKVDATGVLVPGKVVLGSLTEVDEYLAMLEDKR